MNILITGTQGFIGKNLMQWLKQNHPESTLMAYDRENTNELSDLCLKADFVFHLAGVNRTSNPNEFEAGNLNLTEAILEYCKKGKKPPVLLASSTQAVLDNPYGKSKQAAENAVNVYTKETGSPAYVYRLPGVFGKWCRPNYNSVVATFCYNIANDLPIQINDPVTELSLVYIDDVCSAFTETLKNGKFCDVQPVYNITLGALADTLHSFHQSRQNLNIINTADPLTRKLHSTYLTYLPNFTYTLLSHIDNRGSFTEFIRTPNHGQVSVNVIKPGITKGNHWHHTKTEKFLVVSGQGSIRLRKIDCITIIEHIVDDANLTVVDISPGYAHSITNTGQTDLVTVMWADEPFDPQNPDTFFEEV